MSRLTNKKCYRYEDFVFSLKNKLITPNEIDNSIYKKLKILEDIEEELGINLIKAVELCKQVNNKKVVYTKERWGIDTIKILDELDIELFSHRLYKSARGMYVSLDLYEYGKTWALTKEELKNDSKRIFRRTWLGV